MVVLRVWHSARKSGGGWGHSSLEVGGQPPAGIYVSWWPGDLDGRLPAFAENMTYQKDLALEGPPSETFRISGLDERAIKVWWMKWRGSSTMYVVAGKNCSSTVAKALEAGGADRLARFPTFEVWTPASLASYGRALAAAQSPTR